MTTINDVPRNDIDAALAFAREAQEAKTLDADTVEMLTMLQDDPQELITRMRAEKIRARKKR